MGSSSSSLFQKVSCSDFSERYTQINPDVYFDKVLQIRVSIRAFSYHADLSSAEYRMKDFQNFYELHKNIISPVYAWVYEEGKITYSMPAVDQIQKVKENIKKKLLFRKLLNFLLAVIDKIDIIAVILQDDENFIGVLDNDTNLKETIFKLMDLENAKDIEQILKNRSITDQMIKYFNNEQSIKESLTSISLLTMNLTIDNLSEMKKIETNNYDQPILQLLKFENDIVIVLEDRILFKEKELKLNNVLCATTEDDFLYVATNEQIKVFKEFEEVETIDIERMTVCVIRVVDGVIYLCGRVRQYQNYYNEIRIIQKDKKVMKTQYKPAQMAFEVLGDRLVSAKQLNYLQKWMILEENCQVEAEYQQNDTINLIQLLNDGRIVTGGCNGWVIIYDQLFQQLAQFQCQSGISAIEEINDQQLVIGQTDGGISFFEFGKGIIGKIGGNDIQISGLAYIEDRLIASSWDGTIIIRK